MTEQPAQPGGAGAQVGLVQAELAQAGLPVRPDPYKLLREAIIAGEFAPGDPLREAQLAKRCGVSRTPVREALRRLEHDGLLCWQGSVLTVKRRGPEEILDIYTTRIVLEGTAAALAAERRTEHDIRELQWALQRAAAAAPGDVAAMVDANTAFAHRIWQASRNESLIDLLERLRLHVGRYPATTLVVPGRWAESQANHRALVEAIAGRDAAAARASAERHFTQAREIRLALFAEEQARG